MMERFENMQLQPGDLVEWIMDDGEEAPPRPYDPSLSDRLLIFIGRTSELHPLLAFIDRNGQKFNLGPWRHGKMISRINEALG